MKIKVLALTLALVTVLLAGCGSQPSTTKPTDASKPDAVATASIVKTADAFEKAISKDGTWIICTLNDVTINKELVLDGTFKNGKKDDKGNEVIQRKIGLYTQDDKRNVTAKFTLTAPKLTINSPFGSLEHGTFKGDVYVSAKNFKLVDQKIEGNLYFTTEEAQSTFTKDDKSSVTGETKLKK
jgi:hypothetical protein